MPNIWYDESSQYNPPKDKVKYKIVDAKFLSSYHYHGSWFEYTWELTLLDEEGIQTSGKFDTWHRYENLIGEKIEHDGKVFSVISP